MKYKLRFLNSSIFTKISIMTAAIILLVSTLSTTFLVAKLSQTIQDKDHLLVEEATNKLYSFFQDSYNNIYNQRTLLHSSGNIADSTSLTRNHPSDIYQKEHLDKIMNYLMAITYADPSIEEAILFTADGENSFSYSSHKGRKVYLSYDFNSLSYIEKFKDMTSTITTIYDPDPAYMTLSASGTTKSTISFITKISDMQASSRPYPLLGYLMINYSPDVVEASYNEISEASDGVYFVINEQSTIIYSNIADKMNQRYSPFIIPDSAVVSHKTLSLSGLQIIGSLSSQKLKKEGQEIILSGILLSAIGILLSIIVIFILHHHYEKKFQRLAQAMNSFSLGKFTLQLPVNSKDEFGFLSQAFNSMSIAIEDSIRKTYLAETQRRTAELYALQAQMNPHFLANTIESIRMNAIDNDDYDTAEMLKELGNLFRWMISFKQDIIYIEDELEYIETYLDLQRFRFQDKLSVDIDVPSDIYYYGIPRFTLQPLLENALSHGSPNNHDLLISVRFIVKEQTLTISVSDNGPGIGEETLRKLNLHIQGRRTFSEFGVALRNIRSRIQLLFGKEYTVTVESKYNQGTTVIVSLPAKEKEEMEQDVQTIDRG